LVDIDTLSSDEFTVSYNDNGHSFIRSVGSGNDIKLSIDNAGA